MSGVGPPASRQEAPTTLRPYMSGVGAPACLTLALGLDLLDAFGMTSLQSDSSDITNHGRSRSLRHDQPARLTSIRNTTVH
eukprot:gene25486-biopygen20994